jgi:hypothetical protein
MERLIMKFTSVAGSDFVHQTGQKIKKKACFKKYTKSKTPPLEKIHSQNYRKYFTERYRQAEQVRA